eukprot:CAMPEP_0194154968 /NCGR_PEP_ID=MMETSP0152-20130528/62714_1 /TAXON_ID=1049557 /ORGANISM="Thalassiothrix antarctica, Strain L6-D1" /LENGTH=196 /DNA_ID=CAMNT_0038861483 /DNA_START=61 /DNA_END=651 /DNA_ORIENTATION=-
MMNGVCYMSSMEEDERRQKEEREKIRKAVRVEWERLKLMEFEEQQGLLKEKRLDQASILAEERRINLIATKAMASQQSSVVSLAGSRASVASDYSQHSYPKEIFHNGAFTNLGLEEKKDDDHDNNKNQRYHFTGTEKLLKRPVTIRRRSHSIDSRGNEYSHPVPLIVGGPYSARSDSSLLDQDSSDSDEFDEIQLI